LARPHIGGQFSEADALALSTGFEGDCAQRITAAILFELSYNLNNGHSFIPREKLLAATAQLIAIEQDLIGEGLDALIEAARLSARR
jgi:exodeoxyribonuclease V alpha subunit